MYQFKENFNDKARFWFEKKLIENKNWALLPKSSKAIFPVIACYVNETGVAFPSEQTIAILSGVSDKVVRQGIRGLEGFPNFKWHTYITTRGKRSKKFHLKLSVQNRGHAFSFHRVLLEYGLWRKMTPAAKALYPVMRNFSFYNDNLYMLLEDPDADLENLLAVLEDFEIKDGEYNKNYAFRKYEFCEAENGILAEYAGIHRSSIYNAFRSLEKNYLIERINGYDGRKIFLRGNGNYWPRDVLNREIYESYSHLLKCRKTTGNAVEKLPENVEMVSDH